MGGSVFAKPLAELTVEQKRAALAELLLALGPAAPESPSEIAILRLLDALPSMLAYWDREERCRFANAAYRAWFDISESELARTSLRELTGSTYDAIKPFIDGALRGEPQRFERNLVDARGTRRHSLVLYLPDLQGGTVKGFLVLTTDVSDLHRLKEDNERRATELASLIDLLPVGVSMLDASGKLLTCNAAHRQIMGIGDGATIERELHERRFIRPDGAPFPREEMPKAVALRERRVVGPCDVGMVMPDGSTVWVAVSAAPMPDSGAALVVTQDITQERAGERLRKELDGRERQLQKLEAIGTFAGGLAHDFNNIMSAILGIAQVMLLESGESTPLAQDLGMIVDAAQRGAQLSRQLRTLSHPAALQLHPISLGAVTAEVIRLLRAEAPPTIAIEVVEEDNLPHALADAGQVHQVLHNLCSNAMQAMGERDGKLTVTLESWRGRPAAGCADADYVRMSVRDTGHGISSDVLPRMFDPFFTTRRARDGAGLGLAIVASIVEAHRGAIAVDTAPGQSTTVFVHWPATVDQRPAAPPPSPENSGQTLHVLFVDDDPTICKVAERWLNRHGYRVTAFTDPEAALASFSAGPDGFDVVVTDLSMPGLSGIQLATRMLAVRTDVPVIMATGNPGDLTPEDVRAMGIRELMHKPIPLSDLLLAVTRAISPPS